MVDRGCVGPRHLDDGGGAQHRPGHSLRFWAGAMNWSHLVRVGIMGNVGRYAAVDAVRYPSATQVVVRTARGLETGVVLTCLQRGRQMNRSDGKILRKMTAEDQWLARRLDHNRQKAYASCTRLLARERILTPLLDVEYLFDGKTLCFYFLGEGPPELGALMRELADVYDARAQVRALGERMEQGCGPGCGTENAEGSACSSCSTGCAIAGACHSQR